MNNEKFDDVVFVFSLDGVLIKREILPSIAEHFSLQSSIEKLTEGSLKGDIPFMESFIKRADLLGVLEVDDVSTLLRELPINENLQSFIEKNVNDCSIATGNYRGWIEGLSSKFGCELYASEGEVVSGKIRLTKIVMKEDVVKKYKDLGKIVVFIGDGNNDAEAMRISDIAIASGLVHQPANSVLQVADYVVYDSVALVRLLNQIKKKQEGKSVVISAAGIGSRLGLGQTKSLIPILGKTLIRYQIDFFKNIDDLRIVVGYQARELIDEVLSSRCDVIFVFNHDYYHTKTGASLYLGARHANQYVIAWDGDLLVHPEDIDACLNVDSEYIGVSERSSEESVFVKIDKQGNVIEFSRLGGEYEWSGPACINREKLDFNTGHVYSQLEKYLPIQSKVIRARDIDTFDDYKNAISFVSSWKLGNHKIDGYYRKLSGKITSPTETRNKAPDFTEFDVSFVKQFANKNHCLLDLGSGTGLLINELVDDFRRIVAVEKYKGFSDFISRSENLDVINCDLLEFCFDGDFDLISIFGVMNFFNSNEAEAIYKMARTHLSDNGLMLVKHQMGVSGDVVVNGFSEELSDNYYSEYRSLENERNIIEKCGFLVDRVVDIYPENFNRWKNTHFYALICKPQ